MDRCATPFHRGVARQSCFLLFSGLALMAKALTDREITRLLSERKTVTARQRDILLNPKPMRKHRDLSARIHVRTKQGKRFQIFVRKAAHDPTDFSVGVIYKADGGEKYRLVRCNGYHGEHPNRLEIVSGTGVARVPAKTFHIHMITERYQQYRKPDSYAEPTNEFASFAQAVEFVCDSFGFYDPEHNYKGGRHPLFKA